ncbi:MAG: metal-dependent hydrolase [Phycisphaerales bacterium]|nr:metal-dependent hydrolase [Phycisphaerales bacterium]
MDVLTQMVVGAVAAQAVVGRRLPRSAWLIGAAAGLGPDLDVLIKPPGDPFDGLMWHRHFTHGLGFVPIGALIVAAIFCLLPGRPVREASPEGPSRWRWGGAFSGSALPVLLAAFVGWLTHGPLDACTSFGTVLFWPFSEARVSWDWIGIIDPAFTLVLLPVLVAAVWLRRPWIATAACVYGMAYLGLGAYQHARAADVQAMLAASRGHEIAGDGARRRVMPTPINLVLWQSVYESGGRLYRDTIRVPLPLIGSGGAGLREGGSAEKLSPAALEAAAGTEPSGPAAAREWYWFTDGYTAWDEAAAASGRRVAGDMRYPIGPTGFSAMWGLGLDPGRPPRFGRFGLDRREGLAWMWDAIRGRDATFIAADVLSIGGR